MEPDAKPVVDHQPRLNPKMKEVVMSPEATLVFPQRGRDDAAQWR